MSEDAVPAAPAVALHRRLLRSSWPVAYGLLAVANTANAWRPVRPRGLATGLLTCCAGLPTSEQPLGVLALSALPFARARRRTRGRGGVDRVAAVLMALSWFGLIGLRVRASRSGVLLDRAVDHAVVDDCSTVRPVGQRSLRPLRRPLSRRRRYVDADGTTSYGNDVPVGTLDVWRHPDLTPDAAAPVLMFVPGGGWIRGSRRGQSYPLLSHMASAGWICVSIDYRVSPRHPWPAHIEDVKAALAWVKRNIDRYGGDPGFVAISGASAGGHLAALAALTADDKTLQPGFEEDDLSIAAAVPLYGRYDWAGTEGIPLRLRSFLARFVIKHTFEDAPELFYAASPVHRVSAGAPPFFVVHGKADTVIPIDEARAFVTALRSVSQTPVAYCELPCAQHGFDMFNTARARFTARAVNRFLDGVYAARLAESTRQP